MVTNRVACSQQTERNEKKKFKNKNLTEMLD